MPKEVSCSNSLDSGQSGHVIHLETWGMVLLKQVIGRPGTPTIMRAESGETVDRLVSFLMKEGDKKNYLDSMSTTWHLFWRRAKAPNWKENRNEDNMKVSANSQVASEEEDWYYSTLPLRGPKSYPIVFICLFESDFSFCATRTVEGQVKKANCERGDCYTNYDCVGELRLEPVKTPLDYGVTNSSIFFPFFNIPITKHLCFSSM